MAVKGRRYGVKYFLIDTTKALFDVGKGESKRAMMQESYERNRTRATPHIHSYPTRTTYEKVVAKFGDFLSNDMGIKYEKDFRALSTDKLYDCIDKYFEKQKNEEKLAKKTLEKQISALNKVLGEINPEIKQYFTPDNRARWRDGVEKQDCDRYNYSDRIVENLHKISETSEAIAELQRLTGARIGDVKKIQIDEENRRVFIKKSKGGRNRYVYFDRFPEEFERVKQYKETLDEALKEKSFSEIRKNEYYKDLKKACRQAHDVYHGAHAFRYEFAQERYEVISQLPKEEQEEYYRRIKEEMGASEKNINKALEDLRERDLVAVGIITEELGHSRIDICLEYLKLRLK